jgi:hypothetical protein
MASENRAFNFVQRKNKLKQFVKSHKSLTRINLMILKNSFFSAYNFEAAR